MLICLLLIVLAILAIFLFFAKVQIFATLQQKLNHKEIFKKLDGDDGDDDLFCGMID